MAEVLIRKQMFAKFSKTCIPQDERSISSDQVIQDIELSSAREKMLLDKLIPGIGKYIL